VPGHGGVLGIEPEFGCGTAKALGDDGEVDDADGEPAESRFGRGGAEPGDRTDVDGRAGQRKDQEAER
jgi:hypothetical protein